MLPGEASNVFQTGHSRQVFSEAFIGKGPWMAQDLGLPGQPGHLSGQRAALAPVRAALWKYMVARALGGAGSGPAWSTRPSSRTARSAGTCSSCCGSARARGCCAWRTRPRCCGTTSPRWTWRCWTCTPTPAWSSSLRRWAARGPHVWWACQAALQSAEPRTILLHSVQEARARSALSHPSVSGRPAAAGSCFCIYNYIATDISPCEHHYCR